MYTDQAQECSEKVGSTYPSENGEVHDHVEHGGQGAGEHR